MNIIFANEDITSPHIPIFKYDKENSSINFIMDPKNVPIIAVLAIFMACMLVVRGP